MRKEISPKEYVHLINQKIENMHGYIPGMIVYLYPNYGDEGEASGYDFDDKWYGTVIHGLIHQAVEEINKEYKLKKFLRPLYKKD